MKFCNRPWDFLEIYGSESNLKLYNCCSGLVLKDLGEMTYKEEIDSVWNGPSSQEFRKSILNGSFKYCRTDICPFIQSGSLPSQEEVLQGKRGEYYQKIVKEKSLTSDSPAFVNLCYDMSCNLKCPSCRTKLIMMNVDSIEYDNKKKFQEKIINFLYSSKKKMTINVTGTGDPFASRLFLELLTSIDGKSNPNIRINLQTNGLLFTKNNWEKIKNIHENSIETCISLDAGSEEVYKLTRGGNWKKLMDNLEFIASLYSKGDLSNVRLDFVVQNKNYKDIPNFVSIAKKYNFDCQLSRIRDWNTYGKEEFKKENIFDKEHPNHKDFLNVISNNLNYDKLFFGNVSKFRKKIFI